MTKNCFFPFLLQCYKKYLVHHQGLETAARNSSVLEKGEIASYVKRREGLG